MQLKVFSELNWIFRALPTQDYGIDAHIEVVANGVASGRLLAAQIKTGPSYFQDADSEAFTIYPQASQVQYWKDYCVAVVLILVSLEEQVAYWVAVDERSLTATSTGGWKIRVPRKNCLTAASQWELRKLAEHASPYQAALGELQASKDWIDAVQKGQGLWAEVHLWVNKMSRRRDVFLRLPEADGYLIDWSVLGGQDTPRQTLERVFPWADWLLHEPEDPDEYQYEDDEEQPTEFRMGEVEIWRFTAEPNALGSSFLSVDHHLRTSRRW